MPIPSYIREVAYASAGAPPTGWFCARADANEHGRSRGDKAAAKSIAVDSSLADLPAAAFCRRAVHHSRRADSVPERVRCGGPSLVGKLRADRKNTRLSPDTRHHLQDRGLDDVLCHSRRLSRRVFLGEFATAAAGQPHAPGADAVLDQLPRAHLRLD